MAYPANFHRLVIIGNQWGDVFNTTLAIVPQTPGTLMGLQGVDEELLADVADVVGAWWPQIQGTNGPAFMPQCKLTGIKLNDIGPDGHYVQNETFEHTYPSPISGGFSSSAGVAPQLSVAHTLETGIVRGLASRGRMFLPPSGLWNTNASDGRMGVPAAIATATSLWELVTDINAVYAALPVGDGARGVVGVASDTRTGAFREVTGISVGRVVDTIRSRRNKLDEDRQVWPAV